MKRTCLVSSPLVWSLGLATSCSAAHEAPPSMDPVREVPSAPAPSAAPSPSSAAPEPPKLDVSREMADRTVGAGHVAHKVLYSFTTRAQLDELRAGQKLLTREVSATRGPAAFDDLLSTQASNGVALAKLLYAEGFAKKRFAWPSPFATATGEADGPYGEVLLRVELRDEAWVLDFATGQVFGVDGSHGAFTDALADPSRIGAVLFQGDGYREYVLVNESMIARWSAGAAPDVLHALAHDADFAIAVADAIDRDHADTPGLPSSTALALEATLAFDKKLSATDLRSRARLLDSYRELAKESASGEPKASFTLGAVRAPIPPACKVVRTDTATQRRFIGSFSTPRGTVKVVTPVCGPATPLVRCVATTASTARDAHCTPVPAFGQ